MPSVQDKQLYAHLDALGAAVLPSVRASAASGALTFLRRTPQRPADQLAPERLVLAIDVALATRSPPPVFDEPLVATVCLRR